MAKKRKEKQENDNLLPDEEAFIPNDSDEAFFNDPSNFIDDSPRPWVANAKVDKDGLSVKHHLLIFLITIKASWYPDDLYPTLRDKCFRYHQERDLASIDVTVDSFYKSYSSVEFSALKVPKKERKRVKRISNYKVELKKPAYSIVKKKYIDSELIESVFPFILRWYPTAAFFIQTLNNDPYRLQENHFYWIYRRINDVSVEKVKLKHFFEENCTHLNFNSFKSHDYRESGNKIPSDIKTYINPFIRMHYPEVLKEEKRKRKEKQVYYRKKVTQIYYTVRKDYPQKFKPKF